MENKKNSKSEKSRDKNEKNKKIFTPQPPPQPKQQQQHKLPVIINNNNNTPRLTSKQQQNSSSDIPRYQQPTYSRRLRQAVESSRKSPISLPKIVEKRRPQQQTATKKDAPSSTSSGRPSAPYNPGRRRNDGAWT